MTLLVGLQEGHPACKKTEWWGAGTVICLERGADLHMAQLMQMPLTVSCFTKIQIGFTFLALAHLGSREQRTVKRVCVCVCAWEGSRDCSWPETCVLELPIRHYYCVYLEAWMLLPQSWNPVRQCLCAVIPVYAWHLRVVSYKPRVYYKPAPNGWTTTIKNQQSIYVHYPENTA